MRLSGKTAFITGGNSGIGLATALLFRAEGARVAITGRDPETLAAAARQLGGDTVTLRLDVTDTAALERAANEAAETLGRFDIVFANAGIGGATPLGSTTPDAFDTIIKTNLTSVFFTLQAALPHLNDGASLILNGSVHATLGIPGWAAYAATKGGVRSMVRNLASELAPRRIRVNQVTPGGTRTPIWTKTLGEGALSIVEERLAKAVPLARLAEADEIAKAALYLASDDAAFVSGTEIVVDGGATSAPSGAPIYRG